MRKAHEEKNESCSHLQLSASMNANDKTHTHTQQRDDDDQQGNFIFESTKSARFFRRSLPSIMLLLLVMMMI